MSVTEESTKDVIRLPIHFLTMWIIIRIILSSGLPAVTHWLWDSLSEHFSHAPTPSRITDVTADGRRVSSFSPSHLLVHCRQAGETVRYYGYRDTVHLWNFLAIYHKWLLRKMHHIPRHPDYFCVLVQAVMSWGWQVWWSTTLTHHLPGLYALNSEWRMHMHKIHFTDA